MTVRVVFAASMVAVAAIALPSRAFAQSRIKDIADIEGVRDNLPVGYSLAVDLMNSTDNSLNNVPFTEKSLVAMLERLGVDSRGSRLRTDNVTAVMATANLPSASPARAAGSMYGSPAIGDAESLLGGTLLVTPLLGADGEIDTVAIAQVNLTIRITETPHVSQPGPLSQGQTAVVPRINIEVDQGTDRKLTVPRGSRCRNWPTG